MSLSVSFHIYSQQHSHTWRFKQFPPENLLFYTFRIKLSAPRIPAFLKSNIFLLNHILQGVYEKAYETLFNKKNMLFSVSGEISIKFRSAMFQWSQLSRSL